MIATHSFPSKRHQLPKTVCCAYWLPIHKKTTLFFWSIELIHHKFDPCTLQLIQEKNLLTLINILKWQPVTFGFQETSNQLIWFMFNLILHHLSYILVPFLKQLFQLNSQGVVVMIFYGLISRCAIEFICIYVVNQTHKIPFLQSVSVTSCVLSAPAAYPS